MGYEVSRPFRKIMAVDALDVGAMVSKTPTTTEPVNDGVVNLAKDGILVPRQVLLIPYATSGDNDTMIVRLIGWRQLGHGTTVAKNLWIPVPLLDLTCEMGTSVGIAAAPIINTQRFTDLITANISPAVQEKTIDTVSGGAASSGSIWIASPENDLIGRMRVLLNGWAKFEMQFESTAAGTTAMNCLYCLL